MKLPGFVRDFFLSKFIAGIYSGEYGVGVQKVAIALKGKKLIIGFALSAITAACLAFPGSVATMLAPILGAMATIFVVAGFIDKGSDKGAALVPSEIRDAFIFVMSLITYLGKSINALVLLAKDIGDPRFMAISDEAQFWALVITTLTGFLATLVDEPVPELVTKKQADGK